MNIAKRLSKLGLSVLVGTAIATGTASISPSVQAQQVVNVAPTGQEAPNNSTIAWQFDNPNLVNANTIKVFLNGQEVTGQAILDPARNYFGYRPPQNLAPGNYKVQIQFQNKQGQGFIAEWPFAVANTRLEISSVTHNAADQPLGQGSSFLATINGTPGANASVLLVQNGQTVRTLPATQVSSGVYVASVTVGSGDNVREGILVGRLQAGDRVVYSVASQAFAFNPGTTATQVTQTQTGGATQTPTNQVQNPNAQQTSPTAQASAPLSLEITSPQNNAGVNGSFTVEGTTTPGATVRVSAQAITRVLGVVGTSQTVLNNQEVRVGADGKFTINVPRADVINQNTTYTIELTATRGSETKRTTLQVRQR